MTGTPIGNLGDLSPRAREVLAQANVIAAEDTRTTARLLTRFGLKAPMIPYHDHNAPSVRPKIIQRLKKGETVALVSEAGMPLISDPGYKLVAAAREAGIPVHSVPGASAVTAALSVAGIATDRFLFLGFLPARDSARKRALTEAGAVSATLVVFESTRRLAATLGLMVAHLGPREAAVCRELTKKFEEVRRGPLPDLEAHYRAHPAKGEVVIVVAAGAGETATISAAYLDRLLREALQTLSPSRAAARVAAETGQPRRVVYARAVELGAQS